MNLIKLLFFPTLIVIFSSCTHTSKEPLTRKIASASLNDTNLLSESKEGFAILELYTSEGCSSCPPADDLANEIAQKAEENQERIYVLAFHVDYWNRLGWKDRFSAPAYSKRQYWYANQLRSTSVYTPQLIVNGTNAFVGSYRNKAQEAIQKALVQTANSSQSIDISMSEDAQAFNYRISGNQEGLRLHYALIEKDLESNVKAGENRGRKLYHYSVVKEFHTIDKPSVQGVAKINQMLKGQDQFSIIAFLQNPTNAQIVAADKINIHIE